MIRGEPYCSAAMSARASGTTVVYADRFAPDDEKRRALDTGDKTQAIPFLKWFTVFDLAQSWGLPEDLQWMRTSRSMTASL